MITSASFTVDDIINNIKNYDQEIPEICDEDINEENVSIISFKDWTREISKKCETLVENVIGEYDNAQYLPELVPIIINTMKLFPCWSSIMVNVFGFGDGSILAISVIESNAYNLFLNEKVNSKDQTADFVLKMIDTKPRKTMYMDRVYLLSMHYTEMKNLIGDIHLIDTVDTASSMIENLLTDIPSYERLISCSNGLCFEPEPINQGIIISLNAFDGDIDLQE